MIDVIMHKVGNKTLIRMQCIQALSGIPGINYLKQLALVLIPQNLVKNFSLIN